MDKVEIYFRFHKKSVFLTISKTNLKLSFHYINSSKKIKVYVLFIFDTLIEDFLDDIFPKAYTNLVDIDRRHDSLCRTLVYFCRFIIALNKGQMNQLLDKGDGMIM